MGFHQSEPKTRFGCSELIWKPSQKTPAGEKEGRGTQPAEVGGGTHLRITPYPMGEEKLGCLSTNPHHSWVEHLFEHVGQAHHPVGWRNAGHWPHFCPFTPVTVLPLPPLLLAEHLLQAGPPRILSPTSPFHGYDGPLPTDEEMGAQKGPCTVCGRVQAQSLYTKHTGSDHVLGPREDSETHMRGH